MAAIPRPTASTRASGHQTGRYRVVARRTITERFIVSPAHADPWLRLKGRHPLKLIAVSDDPFLAIPAAAMPCSTARSASVAKPADRRSQPGQARFSRPLSDWFTASPGSRSLHRRDPRPGHAGGRGADAPLARVHADRSASPPVAPISGGRRIRFWTAARAADPVFDRSRLSLALLNTLARGARHIDRGADKLSRARARRRRVRQSSGPACCPAAMADGR